MDGYVGLRSTEVECVKGEVGKDEKESEGKVRKLTNLHKILVMLKILI